jgi:hypothetical protein
VARDEADPVEVDTLDDIHQRPTQVSKA